MPRVCQVCSSNSRLEIDRQLVQGKSYSGIAREYDLDEQAVRRHAQEHLSHQLVSAWQKKEALQGLDLLGEIEDLLQRTKAILTKAEDKKHYALALSAIKEARGTYELLSKIAFTLHQAKMAELELEHERTGQTEVEAREAQAEKLSRLSDAELALLHLLTRRMEGNNALPSPVLTEKGFSKVAVDALGSRFKAIGEREASIPTKKPSKPTDEKDPELPAEDTAPEPEEKQYRVMEQPEPKKKVYPNPRIGGPKVLFRL